METTRPSARLCPWLLMLGAIFLPLERLLSLHKQNPFAGPLPAILDRPPMRG